MLDFCTTILLYLKNLILFIKTIGKACSCFFENTHGLYWILRFSSCVLLMWTLHIYRF
jgi:hypothetical protein